MHRAKLLNSRYSETYDLVHDNIPLTVTVGTYADGKPGEVFINVTGHSASSALAELARDSALLMSIAMQYGSSIEELRRAISRDTEGNPSTLVGAVLDSIEWKRN